MAHRTLVVVLFVDTEESTALEPGGTGTLVTPDSVLVHPPLSRRLANDRSPRPARVSVASWGAGTTRAELIDVAEVRHGAALSAGPEGGRDATAEPLVGLRLAAPSACPPSERFLTEAEVVAHLRDPYGTPPPVHPREGASILCRLLHLFCG